METLCPALVTGVQGYIGEDRAWLVPRALSQDYFKGSCINLQM